MKGTYKGEDTVIAVIKCSQGCTQKNLDVLFPESNFSFRFRLVDTLIYFISYSIIMIYSAIIVITTPFLG